MDAEEWRPVVGYEGRYEVSSFGNVRSLARDILIVKKGGQRPYTIRRSAKSMDLNTSRSHGYLATVLYKDGVPKEHTVHTLVCEAFHGPRPPGMVCAHADSVKHNNNQTNLRWASYQENLFDEAIRQVADRFGLEIQQLIAIVSKAKRS